MISNITLTVALDIAFKSIPYYEHFTVKLCPFYVKGIIYWVNLRQILIIVNRIDRVILVTNSQYSYFLMKISQLAFLL